MSELIDVGYHDPLDERDDTPDPPPSPDEYQNAPARAPRPAIGERGRDELEQLLAFGSGVEQVLARDELQRRLGAGYQPSLLGPTERLAQTAPRRACTVAVAHPPTRAPHASAPPPATSPATRVAAARAHF